MPLNERETKDPDDVKDYSVNWAPQLDPYEDTIESSSWPVVTPTGLSILTHTFNDTSTTVWLEEGELDTNYQLTNRIVTAGGRILDETITILVRKR